MPEHGIDGANVAEQVNALPMQRCQGESTAESACGFSRSSGTKDVQSLLHAFHSFTAASSSLEHSYGQLRAEVERLNWELSAKNAELSEAQHQLRREQCLAEVSTVLAHEIRNPLGSLELFAGLLADAPLSPECKTWVEHLQAGLRALAATVNNVLQFHSAPKLERRCVDLGEFLGSTRDFLMPLARQSNIAFGLQNRLSGVCVSADCHRLQQVLFNLILNSVRMMPDGGWIELSGHQLANGTAVAIAVSDTGPGIAAEDLPKIFEPGFSTRAGSPGLGLAVCRRIVEQHGGTIRGENISGKGAKFTVLLPLGTRQIEGVSG